MSIQRWNMRAVISTVDIEKSPSGMYVKHEDYTEELSTLKAQRDELLAALKTYGAHLPNCAYSVNHPLIDKCTCGYEAAIANAEAPSCD